MDYFSIFFSEIKVYFYNPAALHPPVYDEDIMAGFIELTVPVWQKTMGFVDKEADPVENGLINSIK